MMKSIVITLIGEDRPGIVESISKIIVQHQGEWIESHMSNLSGKFAGILRANLPEQNCEAFSKDLKHNSEGLTIAIEEVNKVYEPAQEGKVYKLELLGQDRPGIVHRISSVLATNGATVVDMETEVVEASMSGEQLFKASIALSLAEGHKIEALSKVLEQLANELIVDIELER
jgi:glycine cleavage system regulatory protein